MLFTCCPIGSLLRLGVPFRVFKGYIGVYGDIWGYIGIYRDIWVIWGFRDLCLGFFPN